MMTAQFLHVLQLRIIGNIFFSTCVKCSSYKSSLLFHKLAKTCPFRGRGFQTPAEWKIGYKVVNKQVSIQIVNGEYNILHVSQYQIKK